MGYSDIYLKQRGKPSGVLIVLAVIAVVGFMATFLQGNAPTSKASKQTLIYHSVVNLSARQAGIYYQTTSPTKSWILYGKVANKLDRALYDERDTQTTHTATSLHYVPISDLTANTTYYYKIIADGEVISVNNSSTFSFTTASTTVATTSVPPAYGKVVQSNNEPVNNGFVLFYYPNAYPLVTAIKGGDWLVALNTLIDKKTSKLITANKSEVVKIDIISEDMKSTTIETALENTTPLSKTVVLGAKYSVEGTESVLSVNTSISLTPKVSATKTPEVSTPKTTIKPTAKPTVTPTKIPDPIEITFPKEEALIPGNNPLIKGLALPGKQLSIGVRRASTKAIIYSTKINASEKGEWKLAMPMPLLADKYILSMATSNSAGRLITLSRNFSTTKSGEVVLGTATEEGEITPTTPVATIVPTKVVAELPTPTVGPVNTIVTPTSTVVTSVPTPPVTGDSSTYIMIGSLILVIFGAGVLFFL